MINKQNTISIVWQLCLVAASIVSIYFISNQPKLHDVPIEVIAVLLFLLSAFCEYIDSSLGMGYGTTLTPVLLAFGVLREDIVPVILLSEFLTGLFAGIAHHREGNINLRTSSSVKAAIKYLAIPSAIGVVVATVMGSQLKDFGQQYANLYIGVMVAAIGIYIIYSNYFRAVTYNSAKKTRLLILGTVAAFNKGVSGGGYGPLLTGGQLASGVREKEAIVITSLCECFTCITGLVVYFLLGGTLNLFYVIPLCLGSMVSVVPAAKTIKLIPTGLLKNAIGWATLLLGLVTLVKFLIA